MNVALASSYMLFHTFGPFFFGPQGMDGISVTNSKIFGQIGTQLCKEKVIHKKEEQFHCSFFNKLISTRIEINKLLFVYEECMKHLKRCTIGLFFWLTYIILFTSLQKRVGCIWMFFELQFNCIDL